MEIWTPCRCVEAGDLLIKTAFWVGLVGFRMLVSSLLEASTPLV